MEAIVLAGGFGTRLQSVVSDVPKPMAMIDQTPFLDYIFYYLKRNGINKVILSVGYKHEVIQHYFQNSFIGIDIDYIVEDEPLGTGGAIIKALKNIRKNSFFVINGDTFFDVDLTQLLSEHNTYQSDLTLSLKPMENFDRYGNVEIDPNSRVIHFSEKEFVKRGFINGGIYVLNKDTFKSFNLPERFSFEEFMHKNINDLNIYASIFNQYFIDIGIPEDYQKAQHELKHSSFEKSYE